MNRIKVVLLIVLASMFLLGCILPTWVSGVQLYGADGSVIRVRAAEVEAYKAVGWYETPEAAASVTLYSADGQTRSVPSAEAEALRAQGWFPREEVYTTLYASDGRTEEVLNANVEAQCAAGWYKTLDEVTTTVYAMDGRAEVVYNDQVPAWKAVGWYDDLDDVTVTLYSKDGRQLTVFHDEVDAYLLVGWYRRLRQIDPTKPMVALTFDDGPGDYTDKILDCLEKYNAAATFFVLGNRCNKWSAQLVREHELGMEIGSHSWSHPQLTSLGASALASQLGDTKNKIYELTGEYPKTLRPPYGAYNQAVRDAAGAPIIMWSVDTLDWKTRNADKTYAAVMNHVQDGDVILMHDIHPQTADAAVRIIPALIDAGYQLVTVSELGEHRVGGLQNGTVYNRMKP